MQDIIPYVPNETDDKTALLFYQFRAELLKKEDIQDSLSFEDWKAFQNRMKANGQFTLYGLLLNNKIIGNIRTHIENEGEKDEYLNIYFVLVNENYDLSSFSDSLKNLFLKLNKKAHHYVSYTNNQTLTKILLANNFKKIDAEILYELKRSKIDMALLDKLAHTSSLNKAGVNAEFIKGINKDEDIKMISELWTFLLNEMPRKDNSLRLENSFEHLKLHFERDIKAGLLPSCIILRNESKEAVGMSFTVYNKVNPVSVQQLMTGVLPSYRKKGLSKWMKAHSYLTLLKKYPSIETIKTGCIEDNIAMINLNRLLSFEEHERIDHFKCSIK